MGENEKENLRTILWISAGRPPMQPLPARNRCGRFRLVFASRSRLVKRAQAACKPGSVPGTMPEDGHSSGTRVATSLARPTRTTGPETSLPRHSRERLGRRPYLVLLPVGFTVPPTLPPTRCALAAPFHPYPQANRSQPRRAVYSLWHFPWGRPRRVLPGTVFPWSPDFPPPPHQRERPSGRLHPEPT